MEIKRKVDSCPGLLYTSTIRMERTGWYSGRKETDRCRGRENPDGPGPDGYNAKRRRESGAGRN